MTDFLIKSTLAMGVLLGLYYILFEREKMHRFNRFYLLSALVFSLALPFITIPIYVEGEAEPQPLFIEQTLEFREQQMPGESIATNKQEVAVRHMQETPIITPVNYWPYLGWGFYLSVVFMLSIRFIFNILRFYKNKRNSLTVSYKGTSLVLLDHDVLPHTFMGNIFVSKTEYENKLIATELFTHELVHAKQLHSLDILFIEVLKTIFWLNPLLYIYKKAIQLNHEFLADEKVIESTANTICYQKLLLEKASVGKTFSLASSLNFSLTKKRFIMMTKTTNKFKSLLLKSAVAPAIACLLYFLSTETVVMAKTSNYTPQMTMAPESEITSTPIVATEDSIEQQTPVVSPSSGNTTDPESRKNEYYKGVRIIIEDAQKGKYVDLPYEKLTAEDRHYYLPDAPDKKKGSGISDADYNYALSKKSTLYYLDDKKVSKEEILKYKQEDFASYAARFSNMKVVNGKVEEGLNQSFFYTRPYFNKHLKPINDHYPDKTLKITITAAPEPYKSEFAEEAQKTGKTEKQLDEDKLKQQADADHYPMTDEINERNRQLSARFTEGDFYEYFAKNFSYADKLNGKQIFFIFDINTDGTLSDVMGGNIAPEIMEEIKRVIKNSPRWIPAQKNNKPYKTASTITFPKKTN